MHSVPLVFSISTVSTISSVDCDARSFDSASRLQKIAITVIGRKLTRITKYFSGAMDKGCSGAAQLFENNCTRGIDDLPVDLHNLVSLLLMQRRRTKRYRVVARWAVDARSARCGFGGECVIDL